MLCLATKAQTNFLGWTLLILGKLQGIKRTCTWCFVLGALPRSSNASSSLCLFDSTAKYKDQSTKRVFLLLFGANAFSQNTARAWHARLSARRRAQTRIRHQRDQVGVRALRIRAAGDS